VRIVITGASGNVGTALLLRLGQRGHQLVGVSRRRPPMAAPYTWCDWRGVDIGASHAKSALIDAFAGADAVVHLAWRLQARRQERAEMARTNRNGTCAVAEAARSAGVGHLVHMSSIGAYSPALGMRVDETWPVTGVPTSPYSMDKVAAERTMSLYTSELGVAVVRPAFILQDAAASEIHRYFLGPLVPHAVFSTAALARAPVPAVLSTQVVHADAVADALARIVEQRATGAFNVAADPVVSRESWHETFGGVGPDLAPSLLRRLVRVSWQLRLHHTAPSWLDLALSLPTLDCGRMHELGWTAGREGPQVLADFAAAVTRGAGRPGPLLHRADRDRPGPARGELIDSPTAGR
jgi:nucleoside-diphosphate-sugar epimerase